MARPATRLAPHPTAILHVVRHTTLDQLALDIEATVVEVDASAALAGRLEDLGFVPGTPLSCRRRAPLGDPRVYELRGSQLCLRNREARAVRVAIRG